VTPSSGDTMRTALPRDMSRATTVPAALGGTACRGGRGQETRHQRTLHCMHAGGSTEKVARHWLECQERLFPLFPFAPPQTVRLLTSA
jgi:hypothetical protein